MPMNALHQALADVPVSAAMSRPMKTVRADWSVRQVIRFFIEERIYGAPVVGASGEPVGVVTASDIIGFESLERDELEALVDLRSREDALADFEASAGSDDADSPRADDRCAVAEIMTPILLSLPVTASLLDAVRMMHHNRIHRVFVVDGGEIVGVVSSSTLVGALVGQYVAG